MVASLGIGSPIALGHSIQGRSEDPFDDYPGMDCGPGVACPREVVTHEWQMSESGLTGGHDTHGSCTFVWYGSFYSDDLDGYLHGIGFGGAAQSDSPVYQFPAYNLAGQRYKIRLLENHTEAWKGTENHKHGVYPPEGEEKPWSRYLLEAMVESSLSSIDFNIPTNTLQEILSSHDGFDFDVKDGYKYSNTRGSLDKEQRWSECVHLDTVLVRSDSMAPDIKMLHGYRQDDTGIGHWEDAEYTLEYYDHDGPIEISDITLSKAPDEMSEKERKELGIVPMEGNQQIQIKDDEPKITADYALTKCPFSVTDINTIEKAENWD